MHIDRGTHMYVCIITLYTKTHIHKWATHAYLPYTLFRVKNGNAVRMTIKCINMRNE